MGTIRDLAYGPQGAFRLYETNDVPASGVHKPDKYTEIPALFGKIEDDIGTLQNQNNFISLIKSTWAELSALTGIADGQRAEVAGPDAGTHTDPVSGAMVDNTGLYSWHAAAPTGWQRFGSLDTAEDVRSDLGSNPHGTGNAPTAFEQLTELNFPTSPGYAGVGSNDLIASGQHTVLMFIVYGGKYAAGVTASSSGTVTTSALDSGNALMFDVGAWPNGRDVADFADLKEQTYNTTSKETICSQFAHGLLSKLNTVMGRKPIVLMAVAADPGKTYGGLRRGSVANTEMLRLVTRARDIAQTHFDVPYKVRVAGILYATGGEDTVTPRHVFARQLTQFRAQASADIQAITNQREPVRLLTHQDCAWVGVSGGTPEIALGQLDAMDLDPLITCVGPVYEVAFAGTGGDGVTFGPAQYGLLGRKYARAAFDELFGPGFKPLRIVDAWRSGPASIRLNYSGAIVYDATRVTGDMTIGLGYQYAEQHLASVFTPAFNNPQPSGSYLDLPFIAAPSGARPEVSVSCDTFGSASINLGCGRTPFRGDTVVDSLNGTDMYDLPCVQRIRIF